MFYAITLFFSLFCYSSLPAEDLSKTIAIMVSTSQVWDPDSINSGIAGSEEAVIYVSQKLAAIGYTVTVFANPPENSRHSHLHANPRFLNKNDDDGTQFDIVIGWRMATEGLLLRNRGGHVYLWPHDISMWTLSDEQINAFDDVLWLSRWQREQYLLTNPGMAKFNHFVGNGINPEQFKPIKSRKNPYSCIYSSNYGNGLEHLLDIWPKVKEEFSLATLDIYYGWQHWGTLSQDQETKMKKQIIELSSLGVKEHGLVGHEELCQAYAKASIWTYPSIIPETFCITALRAQFAGALPVIIELAALKETVKHGYKCQNQSEYLDLLLSAMKNAPEITKKERKKMRKFILRDYTWEAVAFRWHELFEQV